ncbi:TPA: hypothetical protein ACG3OK_003193 [Legionella pneumophila]
MIDAQCLLFALINKPERSKKANADGFIIVLEEGISLKRKHSLREYEKGYYDNNMP